MKDGTYLVNIDECKSIGTYSIPSYEPDNNTTYFDSFRVEHLAKEIKKFIDNVNITVNTYRRYHKIYETFFKYFTHFFVSSIFAKKSFISFSESEL